MAGQASGLTGDRRRQLRGATPSAAAVDLSEERALRRPSAAGPPVPAEPDASSPEAAEAVAKHLAALHNDGQTAASVSWVNHHSVLAVTRTSPQVLGELTYLGVDGLLLRRLLGRTIPRTSADLVLPALLSRLRSPRVAIVGGTAESLPGAHAAIMQLLPPDGRIVGCRDGYAGLPRADLAAWLARVRPTVVIAGLGAPLQDEFVCEVARLLPSGLALTCGGYLDQVQQEHYYPFWAYPLKLNWLVRLVREPGRMWRRYTVDALAAMRVRSELRRLVLTTEGFRRLQFFALPQKERRLRDAASS